MASEHQVAIAGRPVRASSALSSVGPSKRLRKVSVARRRRRRPDKPPFIADQGMRPPRQVWEPKKHLSTRLSRVRRIDEGGCGGPGNRRATEGEENPWQQVDRHAVADNSPYAASRSIGW